MSTLLENAKQNLNLEETVEKSRQRVREILDELTQQVDKVVEKHEEITADLNERLKDVEMGERMSKLFEDVLEAQTKLGGNIAEAIKDLVSRILDVLPEADVVVVETAAPKKKAPARKKAAAKPAARKPAGKARKSTSKKAS